MKFNYEGFTKDGATKAGSIEASDVEAATQQLREEGLYLNAIAKDGEEFKTVLNHEDPVISDLEEASEEDAKSAPPRGRPRRDAGMSDDLKEALRARVAEALDAIDVILSEFKECDLPKELQKEVSVDLFKSVFRDLAIEALRID